jgi:signal transduction histidine kinase
MTRARSLAVLLAAFTAATALFWLVVHQMSGLWLDVALRPEVRQALEQSMEDQKRLRALDASRSEEYRRRFDATSRLLRRLDVIRMNREQMLRRFELTLLAIFSILAALAAASVWLRYRRAQARERLQYLDRVSVLQETARRHAHELKGPLTAARLELERAGDMLRRGAAESEIAAALASAGDELEQLSRFTRNHASFAAIGTPVLREVSLGRMLDELCTTFAQAWPNVELRFAGGDAVVCADRDMIRQVLVNLCTNSHRAIDGRGSVTFAIVRRGTSVALDVSDTGGGIPESLRARVFDPYVTTRKTGEGMGLGLSISRKIMLDHGGDLLLVDSSPRGTTFRLMFGENECS